MYARLVIALLIAANAVASQSESPARIVASDWQGGDSVQLDELRGRHVMLFFNTACHSTCPIARKNYPSILGYCGKRFTEIGGEALTVVAVSSDMDAGAWKSLVANPDVGWRFRSAFDPAGVTAKLYQVPAGVSVYGVLLDPTGKQVVRSDASAFYTGDADGNTLVTDVRRYFEKNAATANDVVDPIALAAGAPPEAAPLAKALAATDRGTALVGLRKAAANAAGPTQEWARRVVASLEADRDALVVQAKQRADAGDPVAEFEIQRRLVARYGREEVAQDAKKRLAVLKKEKAVTDHLAAEEAFRKLTELLAGKPKERDAARAGLDQFLKRFAESEFAPYVQVLKDG